ncbi:MAG: TonB-dependent receptor [Ferruginibacter sp.]
MKNQTMYRVLLTFLLLFSFNLINAQVAITGSVNNEAGKPVSKASIHILNTSFSTITDEAGKFSIDGLQKEKYLIEISAVGFATIVQSIELKNTSISPLSFSLKTVLVQLEAVTVTSEKREALLQDLPVSISAISATQVEQYRLWNAKELTAIVPNLYAGNSGDERNVISIRGITTTSYDPAVATYIDGVNQFSLDTYIPQLSDIQRIEVLRGPQGTLYGRNAMGGVINIITKQPTNTTTGFVQIDAGNYNLQRYSGGIRTPLVKGKLFLGISAVYNKRNGYYDNEFNNSSFDKQQQLTGNYYLKYLPAAKWAITLNVKHQNNRNDGAFPLVNGVDDAIANPYKLNQNAVGKMIDNTLNASLSVNHNGEQVNISSQLAWQNNHRYYNAPLDGDFSPLDAVTVINDFGKQWNNVKVLTHEFRVSSAASKSSAFSWTAGEYFFHQYNPVKQATHFGADAGLLGVPDTDFSTTSISKGNNTGVALFGQANYAVTKKLALVAGLRYDYENKKLMVSGLYQKDGQDPFVTLDDTTASVHYSAVSPKLGLQYQFTPNSNVYANYSRGFRTGGLTQLSSDPSLPPLYPYKPEYSNNIEVGFKNTLLDDRLRINFTAFYTRVNNAQVPTLILPDAITITKNTGELSSKGVELELNYLPFKGFEVTYNAGYTNATYSSLKFAQNGQAINLDGKKQIYTPDITSMLALQYSYVLNEKNQVKLLARGEWFYIGKRYFDFANTISQSSYNMYNTRVGVSCKQVELFAWFRNMGNTKYIEYAYDFGAVHLGTPRTYGATAKFLF